jgi:protein phosphatase 1E
MVIWMGAWRVNGNLSVSRAIGDAKDKQFVIGEADVATFDLDGSEDYLVVACDGIWDVLNGEEVIQCVGKHLSSDTGCRQTVAQALVQFAKAEGSRDNMTAIVVYFKGFKGGLDQSCDLSSDRTCDVPKVVSPEKSCDAPKESSCDAPKESS